MVNTECVSEVKTTNENGHILKTLRRISDRLSLSPGVVCRVFGRPGEGLCNPVRVVPGASLGTLVGGVPERRLSSTRARSAIKSQ